MNTYYSCYATFRVNELVGNICHITIKILHGLKICAVQIKQMEMEMKMKTTPNAQNCRPDSRHEFRIDVQLR